jgi:thymidylate synthase (FAD)
MRVVKPSYEILEYPLDALERIERAARNCYKSEERVSPESAKPLVKRLVVNGHHAMLEFGGDRVVKFTANRGFTHEIVRHRLCSFSQESTRYCNYSKDRHNNEVVFIDPRGMVGGDKDIEIALLSSWEEAERRYLQLTEMGAPADIAREVLPIGVKSEIIVKANLREWRTILSLRTSLKAHPRMRELMMPLLEELRGLIPIVFDAPL